MPARLVDQAQTKLTATAQEAQQRVDSLVADAERQRDSLTKRVGGATGA